MSRKGLEPEPDLDALAQRRKPSERNRIKLLDAAIAILLGEGMSKFTSAHIAEAAGLHKPAFYAHFKNVDECLQAVALHVAKAKVQETLVIQTTMLEHIPSGIEESKFNHERSEQLIEQLLRAVRQHEALYRLLRRYHADEGALGEAIRGIDAHVLERWQEYFLRVAVHLGVDPRHFKEVGYMAEYVVGMSYIAIGRVLDGRVTDLSAEAARVARHGYAVLDFEFRRMLGAQN